MNFTRPINTHRTPSPLCLILLIGAGLFCGCRAPLVNKEWHIVVYQTGVNSFAPEVTKDEDVSPQLKASLK